MVLLSVSPEYTLLLFHPYMTEAVQTLLLCCILNLFYLQLILPLQTILYSFHRKVRILFENESVRPMKHM